MVGLVIIKGAEAEFSANIDQASTSSGEPAPNGSRRGFFRQYHGLGTALKNGLWVVVLQDALNHPRQGRHRFTIGRASKAVRTEVNNVKVQRALRIRAAPSPAYPVAPTIATGIDIPAQPNPAEKIAPPGSQRRQGLQHRPRGQQPACPLTGSQQATAHDRYPRKRQTKQPPPTPKPTPKRFLVTRANRAPIALTKPRCQQATNQ